MRLSSLIRKATLENMRDWKVLVMTISFAPFFTVLMHFYFESASESPVPVPASNPVSVLSFPQPENWMIRTVTTVKIKNRFICSLFLVHWSLLLAPCAIRSHGLLVVGIGADVGRVKLSIKASFSSGGQLFYAESETLGRSFSG